MSGNADKYDRVSIALHWSIGISIFVVGLAELLRETFPRGSYPRVALGALHQPVALIVFALILFRIAWRLTHRPPDLPDTMLPWERQLARAAHVALYALMVAVPLLGLVTSYARGRPIDFGLFSIPALGPGLPRSVTHFIKELHEKVAIAIMLLAGAHAAVGLWHHYLRGDDILTRMLPARRKPGAGATGRAN